MIPNSRPQPNYELCRSGSSQQIPSKVQGSDSSLEDSGLEHEWLLKDLDTNL